MDGFVTSDLFERGMAGSTDARRVQLRHLLSTLRDYSPPIELLSKLAPSAPFRARQVSQQSSSSSWWKGKGRATSSEFGEGHQGREPVRVLSGEEELANLNTPKVTLCCDLADCLVLTGNRAYTTRAYSSPVHQGQGRVSS